MDRRRVRGLHRRAARRREDRVQGLGARHAVFRGLPADRGDGRARPRHAALRPAEAGRADQPARPGGEAATPSSSSAATMRLGTLYNIVGFQTKMKHGAQAEVFRMIPGLENAAFARLGGIHRNTFLNSPRLLDGRLRLQRRPAAALRRPDHRRRGLCRERGDGTAGRPARRRRAARAPARPAAGDDRDRRAGAPRHRRRRGARPSSR